MHFTLPQKNRLQGLLAGSVVAIGWGSIGIWVQNIPLSALEIANYRFLGAGIFLTLLNIFFHRGHLVHFSKDKILGSLLCGLVLALQFITTIVAYQRLLVGEATLLTNLHIFVILFASLPLFFREKKTLHSLALGCLLLLIGLYLLFIQGRTVTLEYFGILTGFSSSILFGIYTLLTKKFFSSAPQNYLGLIFGFGAIPLLIYLFLTGGFHFAALSYQGWTSLFILLTLSTIVAHLAYLLSMKWLGAVSAGIASYFAIVVGFFIDFFTQKPIHLSQWIGVILLIGALIGLQQLKARD